MYPLGIHINLISNVRTLVLLGNLLLCMIRVLTLRGHLLEGNLSSALVVVFRSFIMMVLPRKEQENDT